MKYPKYPVVASHDHHMYLFFSEGPQGKIAKGVIYSKINEDLYNLGFGDWNEGSRYLDDSKWVLVATCWKSHKTLMLKDIDKSFGSLFNKAETMRPS